MSGAWFGVLNSPWFAWVAHAEGTPAKVALIRRDGRLSDACHWGVNGGMFQCLRVVVSRTTTNPVAGVQQKCPVKDQALRFHSAPLTPNWLREKLY